MKCSRIALGTCSVLLLAGCGSDKDPFEAPPPSSSDSSLTQPANVRIWATSASAFALYAHAYDAVAWADGEKPFPDPACPVTREDGDTLTAEGDCTDSTGTQYVGLLTVKRSDDGDNSVNYSAYGTRKSDSATDTRTGTADVRRIDATNRDFSLHVVHASGTRTTVDYEGHVIGDYDARTVWSGSGTVVREGLLPPVGTVEVSTSAEVVDNDVCSGEPVSGNTTIENDAGETVVVTYDGDVDCDDEHAATYTLNGDPKGKITGIACAASPGRTGPGGALVVALALVGACVGLRRAARVRLET